MDHSIPGAICVVAAIVALFATLWNESTVAAVSAIISMGAFYVLATDT